MESITPSRKAKMSVIGPNDKKRLSSGIQTRIGMYPFGTLAIHSDFIDGRECSVPSPQRLASFQKSVGSSLWSTTPRDEAVTQDKCAFLSCPSMHSYQ